MQPTLLCIGLLICATLWLYRETAVRLVQIWGQSETFAHGYVVPLIVVWLLWRKRTTIAALAPTFKPAPSALIALAVMGAFWLIGDLAEVNPVRQFALVAFIVLAVPALAGWHVARAVLFPLCFLFFAVPVGEFMLPWLMSRTADVTVLALRASGIPVYRDGLQFVIPSGTWSVVEACSGVRYLIASLMVGALFAYLNYRTTRRRVLFMLVAFAVPIVANWIRAYMIVMIGHLSSNKLAVGVDHLIYGWIFFGVVVALMFVIGARWSEPPDTAPHPQLHASAVDASARHRPWPMVAAMLVLLTAPLLVERSLEAREDRSTPQMAELSLPGEAVAADDIALPRWNPGYANPSATFVRRFKQAGRPVGMFIAYYRDQGAGRALVSSSNTLAPSNDSSWNLVETTSRELNVEGRFVTVRAARLRRPLSSSDSTTLAVRQIYWINGRFEASDTLAKAWGAWYRLLGHGDDGAVVIVYAQEQRSGDADAALDGLMREQLGAIDLQLRKTRDSE